MRPDWLEDVVPWIIGLLVVLVVMALVGGLVAIFNAFV